ncbi:hypothetical protein PAPHI01_1738 [Pancytospora philotis]|nr:hypothetical protein PAPHI01_1738 [Pancytospora philotis]
MASGRKTKFSDCYQAPRRATGSGAKSGDIVRKRRNVPESRQKYGAPSNKKETLSKLAEQRLEREKLRDLREKVASRNKNEFRYGYYSVDSNMRKNIAMDEDELKKLLRYVDYEIRKCEARQRETTVRGLSKRTVFDDDGNARSSESVMAETNHQALLQLIKEEEENGESSSYDSDEDGTETSDGSSEFDGSSFAESEDAPSVDEQEEYFNTLLEKRGEIVKKLQKIKGGKKK